MKSRKIHADAIRRDTDAAPAVRDLKRNQIKTWIARDEAEMAEFRGKTSQAKKR